MEKCENVSIASKNSVCTEAVYPDENCTVTWLNEIQFELALYTSFLNCFFQEEEVAGSPMLCLLPDRRRWAINGVGNWRIGCLKPGTERPRLYDQISTNLAWIKSIIEPLSWGQLSSEQIELENEIFIYRENESEISAWSTPESMQKLFFENWRKNNSFWVTF